MEEERKRKRREGQNREGKKKEKESMEAHAAAPPSEEEVEEFFAILKNMQVAMKYFEKNGGNIENILKGNEGGEKITAMESDANDVKVNEKENRGGLQLDLNAVPEDGA